ncbi:thiosulfate ABC transporter substrate-binding protein CysP [Caulobacter mirabilis]|uniref:Thiosulfate transporter subunit n=1 Tax=Caulobacter mirabilis TaxID=69666 RepID=A0A2D2AT48_9CAUL|nr:thiosulfate ABC transporter substrate-binding protein CysP [Caulobacter mirabilis]ATQ41192.1 thiosulfate transporter subunit [Caulobacter mirabilis]
MKRRSILLLALTAAVIASPAAARAPAKEILNVSYDVSRETFADINPAFVAHWKKTTGQDVKVNQSHAGSSAQARAVLEGLQADVVTFNQVTDVQALRDKGQLIPADWRARLPNRSSPYYSLPAFLVRAGNPKGIKTWDDLVKPGVGIVIPNPKTSGNGRYSYLAAYAYALDKTKDPAKAKAFAQKFLANVVVFDTGGRAATTSFVEKGQGDVLITFEAEALGTAKEVGPKVQVVTPPVSLLAEFPVTVVDKVADQRDSRALAEGYLKFLYTPPAQTILARHYYRVSDRSVSAKYRQQFKPTRILTVEQVLGGWEKVGKDHLASGGILDQVFVRK